MRKSILNKAKRALVIFLSFLMLFLSLNISALGDDENQTKLLTLATSQDIANSVPSLFRQDAPYTNAKDFPLVVQDGIYYVPVDMFALFSYIEVKFSDLVYGFYINNLRDSSYIAFNLETDDCSSSMPSKTDTKVEIFNRTYYVPAKDVCTILGLNFEIYSNKQYNILSARIFDNSAKYSSDELMKFYLPQSQDSTQGKNPDDEKKPIPTPEDKYTLVGKRDMYLSFNNAEYSDYTNSVIPVLNLYEKNAVFFVDSDKVLDNPSTMRNIISSGNILGFLINPLKEDGSLLTNTEILEKIEDANKKLKLITKTKTRFIRIINGFSESLTEQGLPEFLEENGYNLAGYTTEPDYYYGNSTVVFDSLLNRIISNNFYAASTLYINIPISITTSAVTDRLFSFCQKYRQFTVLETGYSSGFPKFYY